LLIVFIKVTDKTKDERYQSKKQQQMKQTTHI